MSPCLTFTYKELRKLLTTGEQSQGGGIQPPGRTQPVGILRSCFPCRHGTPRQGLLAPSTRAQIHFEGKVNAINSLDGLAQVGISVLFHSILIYVHSFLMYG